LRPFELALLIAVLAGCAPPLRRSGRTGAVALVVAAGTLSLAGLHVAVEGARWQLAPLYLAAAATSVAAAVAVARSSQPPRTGRKRWWAIAALAVAGGLVGWVLPVPSLPAPPGDLPVGTTVVALTDTDRPAGYGPDPTGPRQLVAQLWYPADPDAPVEPAPWVPAGRAFGRAAASWLELPSFALDHVRLVSSHATHDAAPADDASFPVVVYAHGWGGFRAVQADLAQALASRGYVVAALDHTHASVATQLPDGEVVPIDPAALPSGAPPDVYDAAATRLVETFAADLDFLLDRLEAGAVPSLAGRLALERVGFVGHSTGGGAAVARCADEPRCAAVVGYDPWVEPVADAAIGDGLEVPLLSLRSQEWVGNDNDARLRRLHAASSGVSGLLSIAGTTHRDVTVLPQLTPLSGVVGLSGDTPTARTHRIVTAWTTRFLDAHLRGRRLRDPLITPPAFEEVTIDEVSGAGGSDP
jgi:dienelactone hydrolase